MSEAEYKVVILIITGSMTIGQGTGAISIATIPTCCVCTNQYVKIAEVSCSDNISAAGKRSTSALFSK